MSGSPRRKKAVRIFRGRLRESAAAAFEKLKGALAPQNVPLITEDARPSCSCPNRSRSSGWNALTAPSFDRGTSVGSSLLFALLATISIGSSLEAAQSARLCRMAWPAHHRAESSSNRPTRRRARGTGNVWQPSWRGDLQRGDVVLLLLALFWPAAGIQCPYL